MSINYLELKHKISSVASPVYAPVHLDLCDNEIHQSITSVIVDIT